MSQNDGSDPNNATDQSSWYTECLRSPPHISDEFPLHGQLHSLSSNLPEVQSLS